MPSITRMASKSPKPGDKVKTPYHYVSADWKDLSGFIRELLPVLRRVGVHATWDPSLMDQDSYGIVLSPEPIDPDLLAKELTENLIAEEEETEEYTKDYIKAFIPPPALYNRGQKVLLAYQHGLMKRVVTVRTRKYTKIGWDRGWLYTLTETNGSEIKVFENYLEALPKKR